jgi:uncharacterized protein (DUF2141 family)
MSRWVRWAAPLLVLVAAAACGFAWTGCGSGRTTSAPAPAGEANSGAPHASSSATGASPAASQPASRPASQPALATLTVTIKGLRNHKGQLIFGVFRSAEGFPNIESKSVYWETKEADADAVTFTAHLPPGRYGASVLHDENRSGEMNRNFANVPTEGYGVTNNPKPAFRAATFNEAVFDLPAAGREMTISVQYF